jgi:hypothetical protein
MAAANRSQLDNLALLCRSRAAKEFLWGSVARLLFGCVTAASNPPVNEKTKRGGRGGTAQTANKKSGSAGAGIPPEIYKNFSHSSPLRVRGSWRSNVVLAVASSLRPFFRRQWLRFASAAKGAPGKGGGGLDRGALPSSSFGSKLSSSLF